MLTVKAPAMHTASPGTSRPYADGVNNSNTYCPAAQLVRAAARTIPLEDAEFLMMEILGVKRHEVYLRRSLSQADEARFRMLEAEARRGGPVQYLVNSAPFLDFTLHVDHRVLIPRPETEELVTRAASKATDPELIIDYGTGSGCIAIALAKEFDSARIIAVDVSPSALAVARVNIERFGFADRIDLHLASSLADPPFAGLESKVGLLISNPPYVPTGQLARLDSKVRDHEPEVSLDGGPQGINILRMLLAQGPRLIARGGLLASEIDATQAKLLKALVPDALIENDFAGKPRYVFLGKGHWMG